MAKKKKHKIIPAKKKSVDKKSVDKKQVKKVSANTGKKKTTPKKASKKPNKVTKKKTPKQNQDSKLKKGAGFSSNNFNYIRSLIWRENQFDYVSYFDPKFINIVRAVYNECKAAGQECTDKHILLFYDDILANPNRDFPYIDEDLYTNPIPYYQLLDVEFAQFPAYLWIYSPMMMPPPSEFIITSYVNSKDGSGDKGYRKYFKEFVDWANEAMRNSYGSEVSSDDIDIFIKFTMPEYKEDKQRWETEIIICNADGETESFGFVPKGRMEGHDVEDEFEKPIEKEEKFEEIPPIEEKKSKEQIIIDKEKNEKLFNLLLKMKKKKDELERKLKSKSKTKIKVQRKKIDIQKQKQDELKRLQVIKREIEKNIKLYMKLKDKNRLNKSLNELDKLMAKIKKLS